MGPTQQSRITILPTVTNTMSTSFVTDTKVTKRNTMPITIQVTQVSGESLILAQGLLKAETPTEVKPVPPRQLGFRSKQERRRYEKKLRFRRRMMQEMHAQFLEVARKYAQQSLMQRYKSSDPEFENGWIVYDQ